MNPALSTREIDACLEVLHRGLVQIRLAAIGDAPRAAAIADALHNLPHLLSVGHEREWSIATFRALFLDPLAETYPECAGLTQPLDELAGAPR